MISVVSVVLSQGHLSHGTPRVKAASEGVEQELQEVLVVVESHAAADPRAMVVHLEDTPPAILAMMCPVRLELATLSAVPLSPI